MPMASNVLGPFPVICFGGASPDFGGGFTPAGPPGGPGGPAGVKPPPKSGLAPPKQITGNGPKTFDAMGIPAQQKEGECVSLVRLLGSNADSADHHVKSVT